MHHPTDRIAHTTAFVTPVVEHWVFFKLLFLFVYLLLFVVLFWGGLFVLGFFGGVCFLFV